MCLNIFKKKGGVIYMNESSYRDYKKCQARKAVRLAQKQKERRREIASLFFCVIALGVLLLMLKKDSIGIRTYIVLPGDTAYAVADQAKSDILVEFEFTRVELNSLDIEYLGQLSTIRPGDEFKFHVEQSLLDKLLNKATLGIEFVSQP